MSSVSACVFTHDRAVLLLPSKNNSANNYRRTQTLVRFTELSTTFEAATTSQVQLQGTSMTAANFEDHPTDPTKVILRKKPHLDKGRDYEEGFVDGMQHQMQSSVDKAVNAMAQQEPVRIMGFNCVCGRRMVVSAEQGVVPAPQRTWVGLTDEEIAQGCKESWVTEQAWQSAVWWAEAKLKEKNT